MSRRFPDELKPATVVSVPDDATTVPEISKPSCGSSESPLACHWVADVTPDVRREKIFVHSGLAVATYDRGCISLCGTTKTDHS
ncbi:MAG: hypothetical protein ACYS5V_15180, partial [Planctomycetota bacterium]